MSQKSVEAQEAINRNLPTNGKSVGNPWAERNDSELKASNDKS